MSNRPADLKKRIFAAIIDFIALSRIYQGVTKSGSPTPSDIQSFISDARSKNLRIPLGGISLTTGFIISS